MLNAEQGRACSMCGAARTSRAAGSLPSSSSSSSSSSTSSSSPAVPLPASVPLHAPWACGQCTLANAAAASHCGACDGPRPAAALALERHPVPADNACLFTAVGYLCRGGERADAVRRLAMDELAASSAVEYSDGVLGRPRAEYAALMLQPASWGGAIELGLLAARLRTELVAVEVRSGRPYRFGADRGFARRAFLIFDGIRERQPLFHARPRPSVPAFPSPPPPTHTPPTFLTSRFACPTPFLPCPSDPPPPRVTAQTTTRCTP